MVQDYQELDSASLTAGEMYHGICHGDELRNLDAGPCETLPAESIPRFRWNHLKGHGFNWVQSHSLYCVLLSVIDCCVNLGTEQLCSEYVFKYSTYWSQICYSERHFDAQVREKDSYPNSFSMQISETDSHFSSLISQIVYHKFLVMFVTKVLQIDFQVDLLPSNSICCRVLKQIVQGSHQNHWRRFHNVEEICTLNFAEFNYVVIGRVMVPATCIKNILPFSTHPRMCLTVSIVGTRVVQRY